MLEYPWGLERTQEILRGQQRSSEKPCPLLACSLPGQTRRVQRDNLLPLLGLGRETEQRWASTSCTLWRTEPNRAGLDALRRERLTRGIERGKGGCFDANLSERNESALVSVVAERREEGVGQSEIATSVRHHKSHLLPSKPPSVAKFVSIHLSATLFSCKGPFIALNKKSKPHCYHVAAT